MKRKILLTVLIFAATVSLSMGLAACNPKAAEYSDTIIVGTTMTVDSLNRLDASGGQPGYNFDKLSSTVSQMQFVQAIGDKIEPMLCSLSSSDGQNWTITLSSGYKWHDGVDVSLDDVKFTLERELEDKISEIAIENGKIELTLATADAQFENSLAGVNVLAKHIFENATKDTLTDEQSVIGCGPFKYKSRDEQSGTIAFEKFDGYPNVEDININTIVFKRYDNSEVMNMAMINGEIDMIYNYSVGLSADSIAALSQRTNVKLISWSNTKRLPKGLFFNNADPKLTPNVKRAVAKAIDYDKIRRLMGSGTSSPSREGLVPDFLGVAVETSEWTRDLETAKELLAQEGYSQSNKLSFELLINTSGNDTQYAPLIKTDLEETGLISVSFVEKSTAADWQAYIHSAQHTACLGTVTEKGFDFNAGLATRYMLPRNSSAMENNPVCYANIAVENGEERTAFGNIYYALLNAQSQDEYDRAAKEYQNYMVQNVPAVILYYDGVTQAVSRGMDNFVIDLKLGLLNAKTVEKITKRTNGVLYA